MKLKYTPEALMQEFKKYVEWVENNPLKSQKAFGTGLKIDEDKMRPLTVKGFCLFAGMDRETFRKYSGDAENYPEHIGICEIIADSIYTQKFDGAAAGLLNHAIIARDLGLVDKKDITTDGEKLPGNVITWGGKEIKV